MKDGVKVQFNKLIGYIIGNPVGETGYEMIKVKFQIDDRIKICWVGSWHLTIVA